jgi:hypothetical protein
MISKEEFIKLYCDEFMYKATGVIAVQDQKVYRRIDEDEAKTKRDLSDWGYPVEIERVGRSKIVKWDVDNLGSSPYSDKDRSRESDFFEALQREIENITRELSPDKVRKQYKQQEFDPDNFDWGGEDSIK